MTYPCFPLLSAFDCKNCEEGGATTVIFEISCVCGTVLIRLWSEGTRKSLIVNLCEIILCWQRVREGVNQVTDAVRDGVEMMRGEMSLMLSQLV